MIGKDLKKTISEITNLSLKEVRGWVRRWCRMEEILEDMLQAQREKPGSLGLSPRDQEFMTLRANVRQNSRTRDLTDHG